MSAKKIDHIQYMDAKKIVIKEIDLKVPQSKQNWNLVNKFREKTNLYNMK
jgi:hypothetical protein